jgi:hypothetical protein
MGMAGEEEEEEEEEEEKEEEEKLSNERKTHKPSILNA